MINSRNLDTGFGEFCNHNNFNVYIAFICFLSFFYLHHHSFFLLWWMYCYGPSQSCSVLTTASHVLYWRNSKCTGVQIKYGASIFFSPSFSVIARRIAPKLCVLEKQHFRKYLKSKHLFEVKKTPQNQTNRLYLACCPLQVEALQVLMDGVVLQMCDALYRSLLFPPLSSV